MNDKTHRGSPTQINLRRLIWLRFIAIAGAVAFVGFARIRLDLDVPIIPLACIAAVLGGITYWTWRRLNQAPPISNNEFLFQLTVDVAALTAVLFLTGGAANPFAVFFLLPLTIAAAVLPRPYIWTVAGITSLCYSSLIIAHFPIAETSHHSDHDVFGLHIVGMWLGFVLIAALVAYFVVGMGDTLRERDRRLALAREQALRDERLVALGTLAAGAAHELGTPLATMAVITNDMISDPVPRNDAELDENLKLLKEQIDRCKEALFVISASAGTIRAESAEAMAVTDYFDDLIDRLRTSRSGVNVDITINGRGSGPEILAERTLTQALLNVLHNAADASPDDIDVTLDWDDRRVLIEVRNHGPAHELPDDPATSLGKSTKSDGLGLGLFLSFAVVNRLDGSIALEREPSGRVATRIELPLDKLRTGGST